MKDIGTIIILSIQLCYLKIENVYLERKYRNKLKKCTLTLKESSYNGKTF